MGTTEFKINQGDALLIIDVQNDFCPGGTLAIPEGDAVIAPLNQWIRIAMLNSIPVVASRDWHPKQHISFEDQGGQWPPHCIQDSNGAMFHPALELPEQTIIITKGVRFDKDQNSVFDDTGLSKFLHKLKIKRLFVGGLALDVCVVASVLDAVKEGFSVSLIKNATQPVAEDEREKTLTRMEEAGVRIITEPPMPEKEVCMKAPEWAEHARLEDDDDPCDDGREGKIA